MTDYRAREGRLERKNSGSHDPLAMVHLRCTNCGYGRMRQRRMTEARIREIVDGKGNGSFLHVCDLCGYPEMVSGLYPRPLWPWDEEAYRPIVRESTS